MDRDLWSEFEEIAEAGEPPEVSHQTDYTTVKGLSPSERLTLFLLSGHGVVLVALLGICFAPEVRWLATPGTVILLYLWAVPLFGKRPLASPVRLMSLVVLLMILSPFIRAVRDLWRYQDAIAAADYLQKTVTFQSASAGFLGSILLVTAASIWAGRSLAKRHPWLAVRRRTSPRWALVSGGLLGMGLLAPFALNLYLDATTESLQWLPAARGSLVAPRVEVGRSQLDLQLTDRGRYSGREQIRNSSEPDVARMLERVNRQLGNPGFKPTTGDVKLVGYLSGRLARFDEPSEAASQFLVQIVPLLRKHDVGLSRIRHELRGALHRHTIELLAREPQGADLGQWKEIARTLQPLPDDLTRLDKLVVQRLERLKQEAEWRGPLPVFAAQIQSKIVLRDYAFHRSRSQGDVPILVRLQGEYGRPWAPWPDRILEFFYHRIADQTRSDVEYEAFHLFSNILELKAYREEHGQYPAEFAGRGLKFQYTVEGDTVRLTRSSQAEWVLR